MMMVVIITVLVVVALVYFAWDEISAARVTKKKFNKVWKEFEHYWTTVENLYWKSIAPVAAGAFGFLTRSISWRLSGLSSSR